MDYGAVGDSFTDDSQAFLTAWSNVCGMKNGAPTLEVPPGKTFKLNPLKFSGPCNSSPIHFQLEGNIVAPNSTEAWKDKDPSRWIEISNVDGLQIDGGGQIDGWGSVWWKDCNALHIHNCNKLQLKGTRHLNSARNHISINYCNYTTLFNLTITAPKDSPNTDGIDIAQSSYTLIQNSIISTGDDCIAINNGTTNINITGVTCGPGHGISVGSLGGKGAYDIVEQVYVNNCSFNGAENGMRIKTWPGGSGYARNITFKQIILTNTNNPIIIDQNYEDLMKVSAVKISGVNFRDVNGTSGSEIAITLNCSQSVWCTDIFMDTINITSTSSGSNVHASCHNARGVASSTSPDDKPGFSGSAEDELSQHNAKKLIDTSQKGLRIPKHFPYFHVEFGLNKGFVHVIDDEKQFKSSHGLNVIRGMLHLAAEDMYRRRRYEAVEVQKQAVASFSKEWDLFGWTKQLHGTS
ncbi:probable polygalacturonase At3g15720 [Abrus precatorius]|uniref:Probable polygalacturonase At3g15720 n=1 Tax=Abrus precatorius TaxID=3816 RepID=A0A8B8LN11_ABRPR|nr:probable polygalacturonase At3g15720 [Abrus precatorius]